LETIGSILTVVGSLSLLFGGIVLREVRFAVMDFTLNRLLGLAFDVPDYEPPSPKRIILASAAILLGGILLTFGFWAMIGIVSP